MTVLTLDEAMTHLNITSDENADELQDIIDAAEAAVAKRVGPLEPTAVTSIVDSGGGSLRLPLVPVISVSAVTPVGWIGLSYGLSDLTVNGGTGVVSPSANVGGMLAGQYSVTYVAGRAALPADLLLAVKEMVRHLWKTQRGGSMRPGSTDSTPPAGYLIPNAVAELLAPHRTFGLGMV